MTEMHNVCKSSQRMQKKVSNTASKQLAKELQSGSINAQENPHTSQ